MIQVFTFDTQFQPFFGYRFDLWIMENEILVTGQDFVN
jgi:hypothetical protein